MTSSSRDRTFPLPDGRKLGFSDLGRADGEAVVYCHGWPGSRLEALFFAEAAEKQGVRLVSVDRPGMGLSDYQPGRRVSDWPQDVECLLQYLKIRRCAVVGVSGGAPYAVACAAGCPEIVGSVGIVGGVAPFEPELVSGLSWWHRWLISLERRSPSAARLSFLILTRMLLNLPSLSLAVGSWFLARSDRAVLSDSRVRRLFSRLVREAFRNGIQGPLLDGELYSQSWGVPFDSIQIPVLLWHGQADTIVPLSMSQVLTQRIPGAHLTVHPQEGHLSLPFRHFSEILASLVRFQS